MPHFAGQLLTFVRRGPDGKTAWERETGKKLRRPLLQFGEEAMLKEAVEKPRGGVVKRGWEPQMKACRFVGYHARSSSVIGLSVDGLVLARGVNRLPLERRWVTEG